MKSSTLRQCGLFAIVTLIAAPFALAQPVNGITVNERVFNDFPTSALTVNNSNSINPGSVVIDDRGFDTSAGGFANRHDALMSSDSGATAHTFSIDDAFSLSAEVTLDVGSVSPRKEAGIRINSPITGDALFIINSDAGEIVAFGGGAPFTLFGNNGGGNGYTPGSTITMGVIYTPSGGGANGVPGTLEYFIDRGLGIETTGPLDWANLEGGPVDFSIGFYSQVAPADDNDFSTASFNNITYTPEPSALIALLAGLSLLARRR
jgi:hypothetical protein